MAVVVIDRYAGFQIRARLGARITGCL